MSTQSWVPAAVPPSISAPQRARRRSDRLLFGSIFIIALALAPLMVLAGSVIGFSSLLAYTAVLVALILIARWPIVGFYVVAACALLVEQDPLTVNGKVSYYLYIFYWPPQLAGLIERPIGFLMLYILLVVICHRFAKREKLLQGGKLFGALLVFLLCVAMGVVHGLVTGGDLKIIVLEVRPFWYLFMSYILAYNLITSKKQVRLFFWFIIICAGIKSIQGTYIYLVAYHGSLLNLNEIMAHEESFFWVAVVLLVILFFLHYCYRPQLYVALLTLPTIFIALVANQRRTDYIALLIGAVVSWAIIFMIKPGARKPLLIGMIIFLVAGAAYVLAFGNSNGGYAQPARAIMSMFHPDPRDAASNLYRSIEDYDLKFTVKQNPILGMGFGKEFLQPILLPNILSLDPYYLYVPHNTIYWVWMRLGPLGYSALWYLIGSIVVYGCLIAKQLRDRYLQLVAIFVVAITFMEVIAAYSDYQLFFYRNVIYLGILAGILMKLPTLDKEKAKEEVEHETAHGVSLPAPALVGSKYP
ncbi:MAG TPA: O-antigen ligase family protein [Ktedonobacteraceae bacterium]|nr:O-antigen ligase family protein [Ktedonobacteraceae bacterium]